MNAVYPASSADHPAVSAIRNCPFDLVARAELAIHGCTGLTNPERGGQPYFYAEFHTDPPVAMHAPGDYGDGTGALLEALTLARVMTNTAADDYDAAYAALLRSFQREDGLMVWPAAPWTRNQTIVDLEWSQRSALLAWTTLYLALDDHDALQRAQRLVTGLYKAAVWEGDTCWFPASYLPPQGWSDRTPPIGKMPDVLVGGQIVYALARFGGVTGNEKALQLAHGLIRFLKERSGAFDRDARFTPQSGRNFHSKTAFILGVLKYGIVTRKDDLIEWACQAYRYVREWGTDFGFFPASMDGPHRRHGDASVTADMIEIALLLGQSRDPEYYFDAERFGRNHLLESQLTDFAWVVSRMEAPFCQDVWCANHPPEGITTDNVHYRAQGGFASWSLPNDAFDPTNPRLMQRSTACGVRALYGLWRHSISRPEGAVNVNLHYSRDTRWATVTALTPQHGGVEVMMKTRGVLAVRVPSGITDPVVHVNQVRPRHERMTHGYAYLEALQAGDVVTVTWPQQMRGENYKVGEHEYEGTWQGETMMQISPEGVLSPLYLRVGSIPSADPLSASGPVREIDSL